MSRSETARLPFINALLDAGPEGASRAELIRLSDTSNSSFYRIVKPLLSDGLIIEDDSSYRLPLNNLYNYRYKLWRDAERLYHLDEVTRSSVLSVLSQARLELRSNLQALWLVGSAAHGNLRDDSDLDFLLVLRQDQDFAPRLSRPVQIATETPASFGRKFHQADSFLASALRYGLLLEDNGFAQGWLDRKMSVELNDDLIKATQDVLTHHYRQLGFFVAEEQPDQAQRWLKAAAHTLGRAMLSLYGYIPAGKPDLLKALRFYYGDFGSSIAAAFERTPQANLFSLYADLEHDWLKFREMHRLLSLTTGKLLSDSGLSFKQDVAASIYILFQDVILNRDLIETGKTLPVGDFETITTSGQKLIIECKSSKGPLKLDQLEWPPHPGEAHLVVGNPYCSVEAQRRDWALSKVSQQALLAQGVSYLDSHQLQLALTAFYLQGQRPEWRYDFRFPNTNGEP